MGKPIRLGKAAGELNVGISTLVDFLGSKGVKIDANPNTKLEEEHYDLLRKEFAADQNMKEQSKFTTVKKEKRETHKLSLSLPFSSSLTQSSPLCFSLTASIPQAHSLRLHRNLSDVCVSLSRSIFLMSTPQTQIDFASLLNRARSMMGRPGLKITENLCF